MEQDQTSQVNVPSQVDQLFSGDTKTKTPEQAVRKSPNIRWMIKLILLIIILIENMIAFRIAFRFLGFSERINLVKLFYSLTEPLVRPFLIAFPWSVDSSPTSVLEGGSIAVVLILVFVSYLTERFILKTR